MLLPAFQRLFHHLIAQRFRRDMKRETALTAPGLRLPAQPAASCLAQQGSDMPLAAKTAAGQLATVTCCGAPRKVATGVDTG
jgi:hypothetical protein